MNFIRLTDEHNSNEPIYINADRIVALRRIGNSTWIHTSAHFKADAIGVFVVTESPEEIISKTGYSPR